VRFRILHLSDFHIEIMGGAPDLHGRHLGQATVVASLFDTVEELVRRGLVLDAVIVSGDVAFRGKEEEYKVAETYFDAFLKAIGLSKHRLYWVPGNHDIDRSHMPSVCLKMYAFENQEQISWLLDDPRVAPNFVCKKLEAFHRSANASMGRVTYQDGVFHFVDYIDAGHGAGAEPFKVAIAGLNSALFCGYDGDDKQKLAFGLSQAAQAARQVKLCDGLRIVIFHHPETCLHPADEVSINKIMQVADIVLTGHMHKPDNASVDNRHGQAVIVRAGAAFEIRETFNAFNIIDVDLKTGKGFVQFYKYLPTDDKWTLNYDINPGQRDAKFKFRLKRLARMRKTKAIP
jgi:predicted phosphodiesterase